MVIVLAMVVLVVVCFIAGLVAQSSFGGRLRAWIETNILGRVVVRRVVIK